MVHQLLTRSGVRAANATIGTVARDRVVGECIDLSTGGNQHAVAGVEIDEILADLNHGRRNAGSASSLDAGTVAADLASMNADHGKRSRNRVVGEDPSRGIAREDRLARRNGNAGSSVQAIDVAAEPDIVQRNRGPTRNSGEDVHPISSVISDYGISNV